MTTLAPAVRSALFVPGHRRDFLAKVDNSAADAVILDLEDGVHAERRGEAREAVTEWLADRTPDRRPIAFVRVNPVSVADLEADLTAAVHPATTAILIPKVTSADDVRTVAEAAAHAEGRRGLPLGSVLLWPLIETAESILRAESIFKASSRVAYAGGGTARGGDLARALGLQTTVDGIETLHLRSHLLVVARAAGVANPMTGIHTAIDDLEGLRRFASSSRGIGYEGMMVIHPTHVETVNEVFHISDEQIAHAREIVRALEAAGSDGHGAVRVDGEMVDVTMATTARQLLERLGEDQRMPE
ncbi:MAG: CoA ester lyase [Xanthomonadales bacterium]|nr:CoA ester lyase [Xanthomonadales bacterium]